MQLGSGRLKTDDRDCAALTCLASKELGAGRGDGLRSGIRQSGAVDALADRPVPGKLTKTAAYSGQPLGATVSTATRRCCSGRDLERHRSLRTDILG